MTTYVSDTFTAANGTQLASHTPDTGSGYSMVFGNPAANLTIQSNRLRKPTTAGSTSFCNNTTLPSNDFYVEVVLRYSVSSFSELEMARNGASFGNGDKFFTLDFNGVGNASLTVGSGITGGGSASVSLNSILTALNTDYTLRVTFETSGADAIVTYAIDGSTVMTRTVTGGATWFTGLLGASIFDSSGVDVLGLDNLTIASVSPPPPPPVFWTSFVGSHEVP